ncbi:MULTISPECIES: GNAT family N-acetyltransferase [unclassified Vibrio]|uniref:GNAT family N-acetyltransferase n=1 Tax=unclassified Vibrio TaxID=2614977 RepID=UPI001360DEF9|nr:MULTISPECIES: N-acetyltransferase [unclassified Vibrio]NAW57580.1 GNAT family N-acetyltransferase [Vibrio sp. V36_P2S2PM302]NAX23327.1 GNAT family N-acetyltransferase [Vibrio sp. V39_P1S14PM300]NAX24883.1 GNAT family N-acetyltransferase [Vibrio sp. V38_P2S17PM301]NAX31891.1 GNAT family N-acetyltransferase [Vibrio sp. V37_P2S8PM304]
MQIRTEEKKDHETIGALTYAAFKDHPHHAPGAEPSEHLSIKRLRDKGALVLSLVAEADDELIGHIAFSPITIDGQPCNWLALAPVSVAPDSQGLGIGSALIRAGLGCLKEQGVDGVVLIGEPNYYRRFGFLAHPHLTVKGIPAEYFMIQSLRGNNDNIPSGEVGFDLAFDA